MIIVWSGREAKSMGVMGSAGRIALTPPGTMLEAVVLSPMSMVVLVGSRSCLGWHLDTARKRLYRGLNKRDGIDLAQRKRTESNFEHHRMREYRDIVSKEGMWDLLRCTLDLPVE